MRSTIAAVLMTILALFTICNAMSGNFNRERSFKLYKVEPKDFRNVVPHLTAEPEHIPKLDSDTLKSLSKTIVQISTTAVPSLDQNPNMLNSGSNTNTQTSNYLTQNFSNTLNKRKSSPKSVSKSALKKSASSSTTSHNFNQSQSMQFHPNQNQSPMQFHPVQDQSSMLFHPNQNQSSMQFHPVQDQSSMLFHPNQNQSSMQFHPVQDQSLMPFHPNQNQSSMQFHPTAEMGNESSSYQLQAPQVAAPQSSNFISDNPGSPSSNGGDVFRQFSRVFGEESNADDGSLYSIVRRTQSKKE